MLQSLSFKFSLRMASWVVLASLIMCPLVEATPTPDEESTIVVPKVIVVPRSSITLQENKAHSPLEVTELVVHIGSFLMKRRDIEAFSRTSKFTYDVLGGGKFSALEYVKKRMSEENQELSQEDKEYIRAIYGDEVNCLQHAYKVLIFIENYKKLKKQDNKVVQKRKALLEEVGKEEYNNLYYSASFGWCDRAQYGFLYEELSLKKNKDSYNSIKGKGAPKAHLRTMMTYFQRVGSEDVVSIPAENFDVVIRNWNALVDIFPREWNSRYRDGPVKAMLDRFSSLQPEVVEALARNAASIVTNNLDFDEPLKVLSGLSPEQIDAVCGNFKRIYDTLKEVEPLRKESERRVILDILKALSTFSASQLDCLGQHSKSLFLSEGDYFEGEILKKREASQHWRESRRISFGSQLSLLTPCTPQKIEALARTIGPVLGTFELCASSKVELLPVLGSFSIEQLDMLVAHIKAFVRGQDNVKGTRALEECQVVLKLLEHSTPQQIEVLARNIAPIVSAFGAGGHKTADFLRALRAFSSEQLDVLGTNIGGFLTGQGNSGLFWNLDILKPYNFGTPRKIKALARNIKPILSAFEANSIQIGGFLEILRVFSIEQLDMLGANIGSFVSRKEDLWWAQPILSHLGTCTPQQIEVLARHMSSIFSAFKLDEITPFNRLPNKVTLLEVLSWHFSVDQLNALGTHINDLTRVFFEIHDSSDITYPSRQGRSAVDSNGKVWNFLRLLPYFDIAEISSSEAILRKLITCCGSHIECTFPRYKSKQLEVFRRHQGFLEFVGGEGESEAEEYINFLETLSSLLPRKINALGEIAQLINPAGEDYFTGDRIDGWIVYRGLTELSSLLPSQLETLKRYRSLINLAVQGGCSFQDVIDAFTILSVPQLEALEANAESMFKFMLKFIYKAPEIVCNYEWMGNPQEDNYNIFSRFLNYLKGLSPSQINELGRKGRPLTEKWSELRKKVGQDFNRDGLEIRDFYSSFYPKYTYSVFPFHILLDEVFDQQQREP